MSTDRHQVLKAWIAAILWLIVIALESTAMGSATNTSRFLYPVLHFLFGMEWQRFEPLHFFLRKVGHVFGYGLLSILFFRAWRETLPALGDPNWTWRWANISVLGTALVASLDEWHQTFIPIAYRDRPRCSTRHLRRDRCTDSDLAVGEVACPQTGRNLTRNHSVDG